MKKLFSVGFLFLAMLLFFEIDVNANYNYNVFNSVDFGDFDSYTSNDCGHNLEGVSIYDYDSEDNELFGMNADYSYYLDDKMINVYDDDPIVQYVPKSLFMQRGTYLHIGKEYGFYVNSHVISDGAHNETVEDINEVDVLVFDIKIEYDYTGNAICIEVRPLWTYTYFYFNQDVANYPPNFDNPNNIDFIYGVHLYALAYDDFYYINLQSQKAISEGLVAPYPYWGQENIKKQNSTNYSCYRDSARLHEHKYALVNISSVVEAESINMANISDLEYDANKDLGYAFRKSNYYYTGSSLGNTSTTSKEYFMTSELDIMKEYIFSDLIGGRLLVDELLTIYNLCKRSGEYNEMLDEYFSFRFINEGNDGFYCNYINGLDRAADVNEDGLLKTVYYIIDSDGYIDDNTLLYFPRIYGMNNAEITNYSNYVRMEYEGYFGDGFVHNTIFYYDLFLEVAEFDFENMNYEIESKSNYYDEFELQGEVAKTLDLDELENDTFNEGYFLKGYSDLISFEPEETGIYYFNIGNLTMTIDNVNYTGEFYVDLEEDTTYIIYVSGNCEKYRKYSFTVFKQETFNLIPDPSIIDAGTEVTLNGGLTNDTIIHVGFTRNLYLGDDAPLDLYNSRLDYTWSSSNTTIATVSKYGTVFAKKTGEVIISACISNRYVSEITLYVYANNPVPGSKTFDVELDISTDPSVPNGTILNYEPTEIESEFNFGPGGYDIKIGYTRCIFIVNGPSPYRKDYTYQTDSSYVSVSSYGTITINSNIGDAIFEVKITCVYKYDVSYQCCFYIHIHQQ